MPVGRIIWISLPALLGLAPAVPSAGQWLGQVVASAIIVYSAGLAVYYLLLKKATRLWRPAPLPQGAAPANQPT